MCMPMHARVKGAVVCSYPCNLWAQLLANKQLHAQLPACRLETTFWTPPRVRVKRSIRPLIVTHRSTAPASVPVAGAPATSSTLGVAVMSTVSASAAAAPAHGRRAAHVC